MQTSMQRIPCSMACGMPRPAVGMRKPGGLPCLGARVAQRRAARRGAVAVRSQLEDALGGAADAAPSTFHSLAAHLSTSLFLLGDAADAVAGAASTAADAAAAAGDAAPEAAKGGGFFGAFATVFESFLKVLDDGLEKLHVPYSYGFAIILLTVIVKVATYPLTKQQVESTLSMQALQPRVKEMQAKYANDPERLQVETARVYQTAGVNPLAGCLPSLATIPVFIGLYKALSNVADEGLLTEGFFWIPSLAGPTTVNGGLGWLFKWEGGAPALGWAQTSAYLVLPVLLVVSQYFSQKVISPQQQSQDPAQQQTQAILKFLPLMIGWFSLNVPSGLTLYWFTNNVITTAQQLYLRRGFQAAQAVVGGGAAAASGAVVDVEAEAVEKKPSGKELNARRSPKQLEAAAAGGDTGGRGEKFRAIKAREAAARAASQAGAGVAAPAPAAAAAPERGAKFRALKEKEAAAKAAPQAVSSNGSGPSPAAAQTEAAPASVAVVEAEVVEAPAVASAEQSGGEGEVVVGEVTEAAAVDAAATQPQHKVDKAAGSRGKKKGAKKSKK